VHYAEDENQFQREEEIQAHWIWENQAETCVQTSHFDKEIDSA